MTIFNQMYFWQGENQKRLLSCHILSKIFTQYNFSNEYLKVQMIFSEMFKKNPKIFPLKRPISLVRFQYTAKINRSTRVLHCNRHEGTRVITLKNCARYFVWLPNWEMMSTLFNLNLRKESVIVSVNFSE